MPHFPRFGDAHPFDAPGSALTRLALDQRQLLSGNYWNELRTFLAVAKAKTLSAAAEQLGSSHATVGRDVKRLQDVLGAQLVVLSKGGAALTPEGHQLAEALLRIDHGIFSLVSHLKVESRDTQGVVRLSVTDGLAVVFVVPALRKFARDFPGVAVHLKSPTNFKSLRENQTDIMLGFSPDLSPDMTSRSLGWLHFLPVASHDYIERNGLPTFDNLQGHTIVDSEIYSARTGVWDGWQALTALAGRVHHCDVSITYGMMIKAGLGIGLLGNYNMMEPAARPLDLGVQVSIQLYAVALTERLDAKPVRLAFEMLENLFGTQNPWFDREMHLKVEDQSYRDGYSALFNL